VTVYLAIDGGNSKTDVVVGTGEGRLLAYVTGGGTCYQNIGLPETLARLRSLVGQARAEAGLAEAATFDRAEIYLAGADLPEEVELLTAAVAEQGWTAALRLDNDAFALLRAGTDAADAIAVVCGAGTNCVGRSRDGRTTRFPALGRLSGDWGGGGHLGWLTLWHAVRAEDGRGPGTDLAKAVADHFGLPTAEDVGKRVHLGGIDWADLANLAPVLFDVAAAGDAVAGTVVARQADEIVAMATVAARRLDLLDAAVVLVLGGGVLRARHPQLMEAIEAGIGLAVPRASVTVVDAPPVLGAGLSALDRLGSDPAAHAAIRAALARPRS
jgi:N-acetylglucosamine kinase-like BadF-type ATPase